MKSVSIRKRRRERTHNRLSNQRKLDAIATAKIQKSFLSSMTTWGGTICPSCYKPIPARALLVGRSISLDNGIITLGARVQDQYCHANTQRCASESANADKWMWMQSPLYREFGG